MDPSISLNAKFGGSSDICGGREMVNILGPCLASVTHKVLIQCLISPHWPSLSTDAAWPTEFLQHFVFTLNITLPVVSCVSTIRKDRNKELQKVVYIKDRHSAGITQWVRLLLNEEAVCICVCIVKMWPKSSLGKYLFCTPSAKPF